MQRQQKSICKTSNCCTTKLMHKWQQNCICNTLNCCATKLLESLREGVTLLLKHIINTWETKTRLDTHSCHQPWMSGWKNTQSRLQWQEEKAKKMCCWNASLIPQQLWASSMCCDDFSFLENVDLNHPRTTQVSKHAKCRNTDVSTECKLRHKVWQQKSNARVMQSECFCPKKERISLFLMLLWFVFNEEKDGIFLPTLQTQSLYQPSDAVMTMKRLKWRYMQTLYAKKDRGWRRRRRRRLILQVRLEVYFRLFRVCSCKTWAPCFVSRFVIKILWENLTNFKWEATPVLRWRTIKFLFLLFSVRCVIPLPQLLHYIREIRD